MLPAWLYGGSKAITLRNDMSRESSCTCSCSVGALVAVVMSYAINQSFWWALLHAFCGWMYVLYWLLTYTKVLEWINQFVVR